MTKTSIIVGMGIGKLYEQVLNELGHEVITVDSNISKNADFPNIEAALFSVGGFDTAHICTPNYTHLELAKKLAPFCKIVFVEKPGVKTAKEWRSLTESFPNTRFVMVKNNQWRNNIKELRSLAERSYLVDIKWINDDRVPNPGTWFTTKELAYGGVSRDLMPHLLSIYMALEPQWAESKLIRNSAMKVWELGDLTKTDYGVVNAQGVYDVDDFANLSFTTDRTVWNLNANWRSKTGDEREIVFHLHPDPMDGRLSRLNTIKIELGLCPEYAYKNMIQECLDNISNDKFWVEQLQQDYYIHEKVENLEIKNTLY
jgi:predicted dehydrogenase